MPIRRYLFLALLLASALPLPVRGDPAAAAPSHETSLAAAAARADVALAREELAAYRGWLKFLRFEAQAAAERHGADSKMALEKAARLSEWTERILANPALLGSLRGAIEWAYESPVDGSGQPFKLRIPSDYDPARPTPLKVYMHGYGGNHLEHAAGIVDGPGPVMLGVLGRSRGSGYRGIGEADVLQAAAYVRQHWNIDSARVHLHGGSMGGGGSLYLGSRYPHLWSAAWVGCGYGEMIPAGNLLSLPIYATHSVDDWVVPVSLMRAPLARLRDMGGLAILDETSGYGHEAWKYRAGEERASAWTLAQIQPQSRTVRQLDFTASDGLATRAWWAEVAEWGPEARPARFVLSAREGNRLSAQLTNVRCLRLRMAEAPFDRASPLEVSVNGTVAISLPAPLPDSVRIEAANTGWVVRGELAADRPASRWHTPGGATSLYDGSPLLIVYGTQGDESLRQAMRRAAIAASRSQNASWTTDEGHTGDADAVPHHHNLYGNLPIRADTEVSDAELARANLVLIGTAAQNLVVARIADRLPVRLADGQWILSDGEKHAAADTMMGLVYLSTFSPERLLFWVASESSAAYAPGAIVPSLHGSAFGLSYNGTDLSIARLDEPAIVACRALDSRWRWLPRPQNDPVLGEALRTHGALANAVSEAIRAATGADFGISSPALASEKAATVPGVTRLSDIGLLMYYGPLATFEATGAELLALQDAFDTVAQTQNPADRLYPRLEREQIVPTRVYRVGCHAASGWAIGRIGHLAPTSWALTGLDLRDALSRVAR